MSDVVVVGAGLIGMLAARELTQAGLTVTVVEQGEPGQASSWAGGGILSPLYPWRYPAAVNALVAWSQTYYPTLARALCAEGGVDPEWTESGMLILDADEVSQACRWAASSQAAVETVTADQAHERQPGLGWLPEQGVWLPRVAQIRNPRLLKALRGSLAARGVTLRTRCRVTGFRTDGHGICGVDTEQGPLSAGQVVLAGGAWSARLLEPFGRLDVAPVRGQMLLFRAPPGMVRCIVLHHGRYLIPRRDGLVLAGSTVEEVGFDHGTTETAFATLRQAAWQLMPALQDCPIERHWAGLRPGSPAGVPFIGEHPRLSGLYINAGHFRNGVAMGPASVRLLTDLMLERPTMVDPSPYALTD